MSYWEGRWRQYCPIGGHLKIFLGVSRKNAKKWFFLLSAKLLEFLNWYDLSRLGPCESWRPEDSENVVVFEIWRFWTGVMAAQSQLIRFRVRQKSCFSGSFLQKIASHGQTVHFRLYSVIHHWKALLESFHMVFLKKNYIDPAKRQNFDDASGLKRNH